MRHSISEAEKRAGSGVKHDIAVPIGRLPEFLHKSFKRLRAHFPEVTAVVFGHVGDGNLHYNVNLPAGLADRAEAELRFQVTRLVYGLVKELQGSISAEHGIGRLKRDYLAEYKDPAEIRLMRMLKGTLDPRNTLNPGKVI